MIRAYTQNDAHAEAVRQAAAGLALDVIVEPSVDATALRAGLEDTALLVVDLIGPESTARRLIQQLDTLGTDELPPVLWLLGDVNAVRLLGEAGHIVNQDFSFAPLTGEALAQRMEALLLRGKLQRAALELALTDRLTGLYNRKYFLRRMEEELSRALRYKYSVGCLLIDVDFVANGEPPTDEATLEAVKSMARFLTERLRRTDVISRFRFSQFGVLLPDIPRADSLAVANDIKDRLDALDSGTPSVTLQAAVGHLYLPDAKLRTALDVINALEDCCLRAKAAGQVIDCETA